MLHIFLHFVVPWLLAVSVKHRQWRRPFIQMMATMLVDLDHLLADPIYDPNRCSINFHPLHHSGWLLVYLALCFWPRSRWFGIGLVIHMVLDAIDCQV